MPCSNIQASIVRDLYRDDLRHTDFPPVKWVDPTGCAVVNQDVSRPVIGGNSSEQINSILLKKCQRMYVIKEMIKCLCVSPTCWTPVIQSTKLQPAWRWWPRPQAPGQPPHHWTLSWYAGSPYPPGQGEGKIINDSWSGFLAFILGCKTGRCKLQHDKITNREISIMKWPPNLLPVHVWRGKTLQVMNWPASFTLWTWNHWALQCLASLRE